MKFHAKKSRFKEWKGADGGHSLNRDFTVLYINRRNLLEGQIAAFLTAEDVFGSSSSEEAPNVFLSRRNIEHPAFGLTEAVLIALRDVEEGEELLLRL